MKHGSRTSRHGFTLVELVAATTILSIIAAVVMPLIVSSTDAYAGARAACEDTDRVLYALDRFQRLVREAPWAGDDSGVGVVSATSRSLVFENNKGIQLTGSTLELLDSSGEAHALCAGVDRIQLTYEDASGAPMMLVTPKTIHRISLTVQSGSIQLSAYATPRTWIGREAP